MKKKLKDLTMTDLAKLCTKHDSCVCCPFEKYCQRPPTYLFVRGEDNKEIELQ